MDTVTRLGIAAGLVVVAVVLGIAAGGVPDTGQADSGERTRFNVSTLMSETPVEEDVIVPGNVSAVLGDYVADSGNRYQQFRITDGAREVKVFCSTAGGRVNLSVGDSVTVPGRFQEYYGTYEIYAPCSSVRRR